HLKKSTRKSKGNKQSQLSQNNDTSLNLSQDSSEVSPTSATHQQHAGKSDVMNEINHHDFIIRTLNEWFEKHYMELNITNTSLIDNEDFKILFITNGSSEEACILCSCRAKVHLTKFRQNFSLSNYYKHMKSKSCTMIKKKKIINCTTDDQSNIDEDYDSSDDEIPESTASSKRKRFKK
ncbi:unnamed protein product, partial [Rotaria sp. Silwood2]